MDFQFMFVNLRQFIEELYKEGEIVDIHHEVDPHLEIAEIHRRVAAANGPALFFHRVKGSKFPVVTNLFGSLKRIELAFSRKPEKFVSDLVHLATREFPPSLSTLWNKRPLLKDLLKIGTKKVKTGPIKDFEITDPNLESLPMLQLWPLDGGHFLTLPLVYTEPVEGGSPNLGMYRIQRYGPKKTGLHFQIGKGGGFHYNQAERKNVNLPVSIFLGGPPALMMSAITPLPENVSELLIASLIQGSKINTTSSPYSPHPLFAECEFALLGHTKPKIREKEGPFGDHYGYYSWIHDFPVFECETLYHRKGAIYPATVVGKPRQEDFYIGNYLQNLLSPLFPVVMPGVTSLWSYGETGFHSLAAAVVKERYYRECMSSAFRILGEGQLAFTKCLLLTDEPVDLENFKETFVTILERFQPETDLFIFANLCMDTLDYTGPELNKGSRMVMLGTGAAKRHLPEEYRGQLPSFIKDVKSFCPGCLVIEVGSFETFKDFDKILNETSFKEWPLIVLVDDLRKTLKSTSHFLWTTFTRFEPAADVHARSSIIRNALSYKGPILIDARMKPWYPPEVLADPATKALVSNNWTRYFPESMEMGDSD